MPAFKKTREEILAELARRFRRMPAMTTEQHDSKTEERGDWQPVLAPENADERRMFDHSVQVLGGGNVLRAIAGTLLVYARQAPQNGSYAQSLYIMANEVAKAATTPSPQSPAEPGRGDMLARQERMAELEREIAAQRYIRAGIIGGAVDALSPEEIGQISACDQAVKRLKTELSRLRNEGGGEEARISFAECAHSTDDGRCLFAARDWSEASKPQRCVGCPGDNAGTGDASPSDLPAREAIERLPGLTFWYRNYRGEIAERHVVIRGMRFGSSEYHAEPQWLLCAYDMDREAEREFAIKDMAPTSAALQPLSQGNGEAVAWEAGKWSKTNDAYRVLTDDELKRFEEHIAAFGEKRPTGQFNLGIKKLGQLLATIHHYKSSAAPPSQSEGVRETLEAAREDLISGRLLQSTLDKIDTVLEATTPSRGLVEAAEWRPLETIPRDGTKFDAWCVHPKHPTMGARFPDVEMRGDQTGFGFVYHTVEGVSWEYLEREGPVFPEWKIAAWRRAPEPPLSAKGGAG